MFKPVLVHRVDVIEPAKDNDDNVESFGHDKTPPPRRPMLSTLVYKGERGAEKPSRIVTFNPVYEFHKMID